ncbi:MAG: S-layer homology domain-containing protein [Butyricicoccus pullicaecorum]|nr:S-layer homology domain-containing protein [Butyricicoccus pullicaecorum]
MKKITVAALLASVMLLCSTAGAVQISSFTDYTSEIQGTWAEPHIETLVSKGGIKGYDDGTFRPKAEITTAELVSIILNTAGKQADTANWPTGVMTQASELGLIDASMIAEGNRALSREKAAYILVNAASNLLGEDVSKVTLIDTSRIPDLNKASKQYQGDIRFAYSLGLITGGADGTFNPSASTTRAETCVIVNRLFQFAARVDPTAQS